MQTSAVSPDAATVTSAATYTVPSAAFSAAAYTVPSAATSTFPPTVPSVVTSTAATFIIFPSTVPCAATSTVPSVVTSTVPSAATSIVPSAGGGKAVKSCKEGRTVNKG